MPFLLCGLLGPHGMLYRLVVSPQVPWAQPAIALKGAGCKEGLKRTGTLLQRRRLEGCSNYRGVARSLHSQAPCSTFSVPVNKAEAKMSAEDAGHSQVRLLSVEASESQESPQIPEIGPHVDEQRLGTKYMNYVMAAVMTLVATTPFYLVINELGRLQGESFVPCTKQPCNYIRFFPDQSLPGLASHICLYAVAVRFGDRKCVQ